MTDPRASRPHMPGYGILDASDGAGLLPWSWATERLSDARTYWLSTVRPDGAPHTMPVYGVWLDEAFYFGTGARSRKALNLAADARCVVCVERDDEAVIVEGVAEKVVDEAELRQFSEAAGAKYGGTGDGDAGPRYVVRPRRVFAFVNNETFPGTATRWTFDE